MSKCEKTIAKNVDIQNVELQAIFEKIGGTIAYTCVAVRGLTQLLYEILNLQGEGGANIIILRGQCPHPPLPFE